MATFNLVNDFYEALPEEVHNFESDTLTVALSNTAPSAESSDPTTSGNGVLANVTEISYTNCSSRNLTSVTSSESGGTYTLDAANLTLTASGGSVGPFRYVYIYNDTAASDELIGYADYGSSITLADTETLDITFNASGILTIS